MRISLVICSRNRAATLDDMLLHLNKCDLSQHVVDLVLVDSASTDATLSIMRDFAGSAKFRVAVASAPTAGLGKALNVGIHRAMGDVLVFTDDDCYMSLDYFGCLREAFVPTRHQFGMGSVLLFDESLDPRVASMNIQEMRELPARSILPAGAVQGANMFFLREIFEKVGYFNEGMGPGTEFNCVDIEMATRASLGGFVGVQLPKPFVEHRHGRKLNSGQALRTVEDYDRGRGAYYASLILRGVPDVLAFWGSKLCANEPLTDLEAQRIKDEFQGAADFIKFASMKKAGHADEL